MDDLIDPEVEVMGIVSNALKRLDEDARGRVIRWAADKFICALSLPPDGDPSALKAECPDEINSTEGEKEPIVGWKHFAELYDASGASSQQDGMLVAAYWVQIVNEKDSFGSFELNKLLKDLGMGVKETSKVMDALIKKKPSLVLQLKKSGRTQQARKTYRLTEAGKKLVEQMVSNGV